MAASHAPRKVVGRAKRLEFRKILRKPTIGVTCGDFATKSRRSSYDRCSFVILSSMRGKRSVLGGSLNLPSYELQASSRRQRRVGELAILGKRISSWRTFIFSRIFHPRVCRIRVPEIATRTIMVSLASVG